MAKKPSHTQRSHSHGWQSDFDLMLFKHRSIVHNLLVIIACLRLHYILYTIEDGREVWSDGGHEQIVMCSQTLDAVSTCRCFIPLLHRESHPLSDYCLFCIVLYSGQMPRATEHNTGHNRRTQRGTGSWQEGATHTHICIGVA